MTSYPLSNVLLPAVFISSAVFSTLTLPFALIKSEPVVVELPPFFSGEIQPIFNGAHKEVAIPYVGFAIVVSVGAGIASVEVNRRWQAYRESAQAQEQLQNLQQISLEQETPQEAQDLPEYRPEASAIDFSTTTEGGGSQSLSAADAMTEAQHISVEAPEQVIDATQLGFPPLSLPHQTTVPAVVSEDPNLSQPTSENNSVQLVSSRVGSKSAVRDLDSACGRILESRTLYQTCRIEVPHLEQRLFAILVDGQYYSFFRAEKTKDKVLDIMAKIRHKSG